jgi:hypothetical protein
MTKTELAAVVEEANRTIRAQNERTELRTLLAGALGPQRLEALVAELGAIT